MEYPKNAPMMAPWGFQYPFGAFLVLTQKIIHLEFA
jgi:hypothetical protein